MAYTKGTLAGDFINGVLSELNGVIGVAVIEITAELAMDTHSVRSDFDMDVSAAHMMEVIKAQEQMVKGLQMNDSIKDIFITLDTQVHFMTLSKNKKALFYVVAEAQGSNLSIMRSVIRKYAKGL